MWKRAPNGARFFNSYLVDGLLNPHGEENSHRLAFAFLEFEQRVHTSRATFDLAVVQPSGDGVPSWLWADAIGGGGFLVPLGAANGLRTPAIGDLAQKCSMMTRHVTEAPGRATGNEYQHCLQDSEVVVTPSGRIGFNPGGDLNFAFSDWLPVMLAPNRLQCNQGLGAVDVVATIPHLAVERRMSKRRRFLRLSGEASLAFALLESGVQFKLGLRRLAEAKANQGNFVYAGAKSDAEHCLNYVLAVARAVISWDKQKPTVRYGIPPAFAVVMCQQILDPETGRPSGPMELALQSVEKPQPYYFIPGDESQKFFTHEQANTFHNVVSDWEGIFASLTHLDYNAPVSL